MLKFRSENGQEFGRKTVSLGRKTVKNFDHKTDVMGAENGRENGVGSCVGKQTKFVVILVEFQLRIDTEVWVEIWFRRTII